jgi:C-terminal processing protease CtpA/Prc
LIVVGGADFEHIQALEDKVAELEARVLELEEALDSQPAPGAAKQTSSVDIRSTRMNRLLTTKALVKAGLSEDMAADIVRRRNDIELRKLELQDRASREGYLGTTRYSRELTAVVEEQITLREELGDAAYDQYLYANGMPNRVKINSVMLGSTAEEAGVKDGDLVLTYADQRVFEWTELKNATSEGELGEYVNMDISRDGQPMSLWVPRGPLGVRLGTARVAP